ncbi:carbonic anhydrase [Psychroflexus gondwanensis]|jgi:carbonic anhydrase|uniref:Carbonic anhydrase, beta-type n=1 Tax=Psychroflexus gondwanensis ACAM 44 TaxID=1189619 RepID=N1WQF1_9FLAO|nr:carbonic anhydrase family protein [Psychroflexus gondwanensis]EMY82496.1 carbonic anhydrase, beta-type [Psychroflexus gondwanensis ACAM 44]TXE21281.1 carbonic anhydrase [Psychroflexus gondwanensis]
MRLNKIITKQEQEALTPDEILKDLLEGNSRFTSDNFHSRDYNALKVSATIGQYPKAVILSCVDSRVPVETVFDQGIGDIFVARVAGNFENKDILGSMEYACKVAGSKLVFVMGHESCGAVSAACDGIELGNITHLLSNIKPAVEAVKTEGKRDSTNKKFVHDVVEKNVRLTIDRVREKSPILKDMEDKGDIKIVGGVYSLQSGKVELLSSSDF